ncbi:hypothetical protein [Maribacter sp.]|uniref:hypothetical protein n=1 Tax=Maribacter sp. TaxID=1897614 RepID=UPI0025BD6A9D|nr:hypothetical protein [Maribacter sp.]
MRNFLQLIIVLLFLSSCASHYKVPFALGKVYTQKWIAEDNLQEHGYNVIIPIVRLNNKNAILQNVYHKGRMLKLKIKLKEIGVVAMAKFPEESFIPKKDVVIEEETDSSLSSKEAAILNELKDNELVVSYWVDDKINYHKISNIRHNPMMSYPNSVMAEFD